jgi:hypothetical protein
LRGLQQEQAKLGGSIIVASTSTLAGATEPAIKHGNKDRDGDPPLGYYTLDQSEGTDDDR